jgi:hypothetical protein
VSNYLRRIGRRRGGILAVVGALALTAAGYAVRQGPSVSGASTIPAVRSAEDHPRPVLLVVFRPDDCTSYQEFLAQWNEAHRSGEIRVLGVPVHGSGDVRARIAELFQPAFPLRADLEGEVVTSLLRMGYTRTPVALLLDPEGRPRMVVQPSPHLRLQAGTAALVHEYARSMSPARAKPGVP